MTFAERLRALRTEKRMSLDDVAKHIGCGRANIYKYEHGLVTNVPPERVHQLANLFGVSRPYIMGWTDDRAEKPENLDTVVEKMSTPLKKQLQEEKDPVYWKAFGRKTVDCTTAATQAARALIKFGISRTPIYPQQIVQASQYATMVSYADVDEIMDTLETNTLFTREVDDVVWCSIIPEEHGHERYLFTVNRNAPMGRLKLALAIELGHIYLGHSYNIVGSDPAIREAECFALHLEFPRALIRLLHERGVVLTKRMFSRIFGDCESCLGSILNAHPVSISPDLNRLVKEQFKPYVDQLEDIGIFLAEQYGEELDFSNYMAGYED